MKTKKIIQQGATLLEMTLVLVIMSFLLIVGIRQYEMYRTSASIEQIKTDVNLLFQAMRLYYYANCNRKTLGVFPPGLVTANKTKVIKLSSLISGGYLRGSQISIPILSNTLTTVNDVFILQFVPYQIVSKMNYYDKVTKKNYPIKRNIWMMQVGVILNNNIRLDAAAIKTYRKVLNADCLVAMYNGKLDSCVRPTIKGRTKTVLTWIRAPSMSDPILNQSTNWQQRGIVKTFENIKATYSSVPPVDRCGG